jgi:uncharacterized protein YfiM (DUF2279 family)
VCMHLRSCSWILLPCVMLGATPALADAPYASLHSLPPDDWLGPDKALHFSISIGLAGAGYAGGALLCPEKPHVRWLTGAGVALGAGLGKEFYDLARGTRFSWPDLAWDAAGTATGLALSWAIEQILIRGSSPQPAKAPPAARTCPF